LVFLAVSAGGVGVSPGGTIGVAGFGGRGIVTVGCPVSPLSSFVRRVARFDSWFIKVVPHAGVSSFGVSGFGGVIGSVMVGCLLYYSVTSKFEIMMFLTSSRDKHSVRPSLRP